MNLLNLYKIKKQQNVIKNSYEKPLFYDIDNSKTYFL
ncbi:hypothetical protein CLV95_12051 [Leptospira borgpetersenii serovar Javanica]|nr:Uncharacterized protein LB4E_0525 [Leptospira borgpetersenii str. 4E]PTM43764.1 hypothetical protein CLV95_12051 [Leptospira borgpetersenii serovar Javanica]